MATFQFFHEFKKYLGDDKIIDLGADAFKAGLTNTAPSLADDDTWSDITEISAGNGYAAGGVALTGVTWSETGAGTGIWRFTCADFGWTASGGNIGPARYVIVYDDTTTAPADVLVGQLDNGTAFTITDGNQFTADVGASGVFELN